MSDDAPDALADMAWHALTTLHAGVAEGSGGARRYDTDVSVFAGVADDSAGSWADLGEVIGPGGIAVLFRAAAVPDRNGWVPLRSGTGHQMVLTGTLPPVPQVAGADGLRDLGSDDADAMAELVAMTEPGPWRPLTWTLGGYVGIVGPDSTGADRLLAMAGHRMRVDGFTEISAVCTHPDARRRGYAEVVTTTVALRLLAGGIKPMLHVAETNDRARRVYERLGFTTRRMTTFTAVRRTP